MRRREFITLIGGVAAAGWPLDARAQQPERVRRIGVLMSAAIETDQQAGVAAFKETLHQLGWVDDHNVRFEVRWAGADPAEARKGAEELVALPADVVMVAGQLGLQMLLQATRSVPIVFTVVADPVGSGFIESLARPGGNATGFILFDYGLAAKWLELLKQVAPTVTRAAVLRDAGLTAGIGQFAVIQSVASSIGVDVSAINMRNAREIEHDIVRFATSPNGGLILTGSALSVVDRDLIIALAAQHKLPAVYYRRYFVAGGGLMSYGPCARVRCYKADMPVCNRVSIDVVRPPRRKAVRRRDFIKAITGSATSWPLAGARRRHRKSPASRYPWFR